MVLAGLGSTLHTLRCNISESMSKSKSKSKSKSETESVPLPLRLRESPAYLPLLAPLPAPRPANRIVSLGDSDSNSDNSAAVAVVADQVVPSCLCGGRVPLESQSLADSVSRMTCPPSRWSVLPESESESESESVSCRVRDSDDLRCTSCLRSRNSSGSRSPVRTRPRPRPRAQCSRKTVSDNNSRERQCRHTSCQSVYSVDSTKKPVPVLNVEVEVDVEVNVGAPYLDRDQRTVCVTSSATGTRTRSDECSDLVNSENKFKCNAVRNRHYGKSSKIEIRFSLQRFCSAVLCGLVLLTALRPHFSMAAPVPRSGTTFLNPCGDSTSIEIPGAAAEDAAAGSAEDRVRDLVAKLRPQIQAAIELVSNVRKRFCEDKLGLSNCGDGDGDTDILSQMNISAFKIIPVDKTLGKSTDPNHFDEAERVEEALISIHKNFQMFILELKNINEKGIKVDQSFSEDFSGLKKSIARILCEMRDLMKLKGVAFPEDVKVEDAQNVDLTSTLDQTLFEWLILSETAKNVEYFGELLKHLSHEKSPESSRNGHNAYQQSTKL